MATRTPKQATPEDAPLGDPAKAVDNPTPDDVQPVEDPTPDDLVVDEVVGPEPSDADNANTPVEPTQEELVERQKAAEAASAALGSAPEVPNVETHKVMFHSAHTFGNRVYVEGETADVPKDHPFYGMSPKEQKEKYGHIIFTKE